MKHQEEAVDNCGNCQHGIRCIGQAVYCQIHLTYSKTEDKACSFGVNHERLLGLSYLHRHFDVMYTF